MKINKVTVIVILTAQILLFVSCLCLRNPKPLDMSLSKPIYTDPMCGDSVIWHLHFHDGFKGDTVLIVVYGDTLPDAEMKDLILKISSGENGCSNVQIACYVEDEEYVLFISNMPYFSGISRYSAVRRDSIDISIIVNGVPTWLKTSLKFNKFFGIYYARESKEISVLKGKSCFTCW